ncbi:MAG: DMT family transporter [Chloroflexota bacterium]|nr:MAG: hypothetical protein DIU68_01175 [Chloroflexota bacterium]
MKNRAAARQGIVVAMLTPVLLGLAPIFGKLAINGGADPFTVAAVRTCIAAALLWLIYAVFFRRWIYIYPAGLLGCIVVGVVNGIGSLFYYGGLGLLDASLVQLLNGAYLIFAILLTRIGGERISRRLLLRVGMVLVALALITGFSNEPVNWLGVGLMLANALMFAGMVILSEYVLFEMPAPTATLYILTSMAVLVVMVWAAVGQRLSPDAMATASGPILALAISTALSRLTMFSGVKILGSLQTAVLAVGEIGVALCLAFFVLGERLAPAQWVGVAILAVGLLLVRPSDFIIRPFNPGALMVRDMAQIQFQRIAFHRAFGTDRHDNEYGTMGELTLEELQLIQQMMGVANGSVDPFPLQQKARQKRAETEQVES